MKIKGLLKRLQPLALKIGGKLPLCPWRVLFTSLHWKTFGASPPQMEIEEVEREARFIKLRFGKKETFWFPSSVHVNLELWNEYLSVCWDHPANAHFYARSGTEVRPGDVVIDCGCCEGAFARQALDAGASQVVCVEPSPEMFASLQRTFEKEIQEGRIVLSQVACGAFRGQAQFNVNSANVAAGQLGGVAADHSVPVETITGLCRELNLQRVDLIKMDIEGAEIQAVEGAMECLKRFAPKLAICTYHRPYDFAALKTLLVAAGYRKILPVGITEMSEPGQWRPALLHACK